VLIAFVIALSVPWASGASRAALSLEGPLTRARRPALTRALCPAGWHTGIDAADSPVSIVQLATAASRPPCRASLRAGFASPDRAATSLDLGACEKDEKDQQPELQP
jgi:hypothetical protein